MKQSKEWLASCYGAYYGCQVEYQGSDGYPDKMYPDTTKDDYKELFRMHSIDCTNPDNRGILGDILMKDGQTEPIEVDLTDCKLALRSLPDITDEDAIEVGKMLGVSYSNDDESDAFFDKCGLIEWLKELVNGVDDLNGRFLNQIISLIDYLRSKGYDVGYREVPSLIEAKIAVRIKTLKK